MPQLLGIKIQNYRALQSIELGQTGYGKGVPLPRLVCFVGPNGSGKSTILDAFSFLSDCLREGVEAACDKPHRGGFERLRTQGSSGAIKFLLYYRETPNSRPITYELEIGLVDNTPVVTLEILRQRRKNQSYGQPYPFLRLRNGEGQAWSGAGTEAEESSASVDVNLDDASRLGITTLGQLKEHPRILGLRSYIEGWYLSYFVPDAARNLPPSGAQRHLDRTGANLGNYLQHLRRAHSDRFEKVLAEVAKKIPGITSINCIDSPDRRLLIQFNESGYSDPFYQTNMSDGTLKLLAYLLLLQDPEPHPLIGIEEPENGLYHRLLQDLAAAFLDQTASPNSTQTFITTHSPSFVDALHPDFVWLLQKKGGERGVEIIRTSDIPAVKELYEEGIPLGSLWFSRHFNERGFGDGQ